MKSRITFLLLCFLLSGFWFPASGYAACTSPTGAAGHMIYDGDAHVPEYCDGVSWVVMAPTINLPPTNGLVGYWKLDDGSGTSAVDSSGNNNTGTLTGSPLPAWTTGGYYNGALIFDIVQNLVSIPTSASLQFSGPFSTSVWLKTSALNSSSETGFVGNGNWPATGWTLADNGPSSSNIYFRILPSSGGACGTGEACLSRSLVNDGAWHNIVGVYDGTNVKLYLDGVLRDTAAGTGGFTNNTNAVLIGNGNGGGGMLLDDARIYNRALSAAEVTTLYNYHISPPSSGLVGWWKFDESAGTVAADSSGNGNTGTLYNGPTWTTGMNNGALSFDGTSQYGTTASYSFVSTTAFTIAAWIYPTSSGPSVTTDPGDLPMILGDSSNYMGVSMGTVNGTNGLWVVATTSGHVVYDLGCSFTVNQWTHIAGVFNGTNLYLYENGSLCASGAAGGNTGFSSGTMLMGKASGSPVSYFPGKIDDVRIYNRALSADEVYGIYRTSSPVCSNPSSYEGDVMYNNGTNHVLQFCDNASWRPLGPVPGAGGSGCTNPAHPEGDMIYNDSGAGSGVMQYCDGTNWIKLGGPNFPTSGLVGYWKLDDGSGISAIDSSGQGNTGTLTNSPTWTTSGKISGALKFVAASSQYVNVPDAPSLDLAGSWTLAAWVNPTSMPAASAAANIIGRDSTCSGCNTNYELTIDHNDHCGGLGWRAGFDTSGGASTSACYVTTISTGTWYHVTGVWDSSAKNLRIYLNGSLVATYHPPVNVPATGTGGPLGLGTEPTQPRYFDGIIDDARVYNRALSAQEIWQLYLGLP